MSNCGLDVLRSDPLTPEHNYSFTTLRVHDDGKLEVDAVRCYRPHGIAILGNSIFVGETDNPKRSGYLWQVKR